MILLTVSLTALVTEAITPLKKKAMQSVACPEKDCSFVDSRFLAGSGVTSGGVVISRSSTILLRVDGIHHFLTQAFLMFGLES